MTSKRVVILLIVVVLIASGLFVLLQNKQPTPAERLKAEQEVYAALLVDQKNAYGDPPDTFELVEYTNSGELQGNSSMNTAGYDVGFDTEDFTDLQRKTWIDYQEVNQISYLIKEFLPPNANVILINPDYGGQLYGWISFSRIGFNASLTQALVLVGDCRGEMCYDENSNSMYSRGNYMLLQKIVGVWHIVNWQNAWLIEAPAP